MLPSGRRQLDQFICIVKKMILKKLSGVVIKRILIVGLCLTGLVEDILGISLLSQLIFSPQKANL
jgi:hypothetical protein